ncbi:Uma2 family endonuclease [Streptomyces scabiei]|uniref:Uma2 family endonuclease n=1 Tax=Streptomyces scabiei TaxID=1930 RepID=UPI0036C07C94
MRRCHPSHEKGHPHDSSCGPAASHRGTRGGRWSDPAGALMAVEITSHDRATDRRDRVDKPLGYAAAEIPVHLLIDRDRDHTTVTVFSEPKDGRYRRTESCAWGATVELPAPVNITLDTEKLKDYAG